MLPESLLLNKNQPPPDDDKGSSWILELLSLKPSWSHLQFENLSWKIWFVSYYEGREISENWIMERGMSFTRSIDKSLAKDSPSKRRGRRSGIHGRRIVIASPPPPPANFYYRTKLNRWQTKQNKLFLSGSVKCISHVLPFLRTRRFRLLKNIVVFSFKFHPRQQVCTFSLQNN